MSDKDFGAYLYDVSRAIEKIKKYTEGYDFYSFSKDERTFDAVARNFQIIGEALKKIPVKVLEPYDTINWKDIKGMRDIVVHDYNDIDPEIMWRVIQEKMDDLAVVISQIRIDSGK